MRRTATRCPGSARCRSVDHMLGHSRYTCSAAKAGALFSVIAPTRLHSSRTGSVQVCILRLGDFFLLCVLVNFGNRFGRGFFSSRNPLVSSQIKCILDQEPRSGRQRLVLANILQSLEVFVVLCLFALTRAAFQVFADGGKKLAKRLDIFLILGLFDLFQQFFYTASSDDSLIDEVLDVELADESEITQHASLGLGHGFLDIFW
mmetsp:Transcript_15510/g.27227  ORF Transcript_15510/g.27227 Transcript_15510/m.27227 type:complete len:204 (-) Transcript_15510:521-1132(-)